MDFVSAGHAELDVNKDAPKELMVPERDRENSWLLGDQVDSKLVKVFGKAIGKIPTVQKHKRKENKYLLGWMLIWTMV